MGVKQLMFRDEARAKMRRGVDLLADAVKVTRLALQNAASIAGLILTTDCMIANAPLPRPAAPFGPAAAAEAEF